MVMPPVLYVRNPAPGEFAHSELPIGSSGSFNLPRVGEDLVLYGKTYSVKAIVWEYDQDHIKVVVDRIM